LFLVAESRTEESGGDAVGTLVERLPRDFPVPVDQGE